MMSVIEGRNGDDEEVVEITNSDVIENNIEDGDDTILDSNCNTPKTNINSINDSY